jgi:RNA polymerase sigma-70 factor (ECF subfamily)
MLMDRYSDFAYALAYRLLYNREEAEDAVHEGFTRIWKHMHEYDLNKKFSTWMYTIITHYCYDLLRKRSREKCVLNTDCWEEFDLKDPHIGLNTNEILPYIEQAAETLPPKQRVIFILRDLQDLPVREVSEILQISKNSVKVNLHYARKHLREQLKGKL